MNRRIPRALGFLIALLPLLLAMGGGGSPSSDTIPRPKEKHTAELLDRQGVVTRVTYVCCNGKTFFPLERGEGVLMVPFEKVTRVRIGEEEGTRVQATIHVQGGKALEGTLPRSLLFTGATDYGNFQVEARGLTEITFK